MSSSLMLGINLWPGYELDSVSTPKPTDRVTTVLSIVAETFALDVLLLVSFNGAVTEVGLWCLLPFKGWDSERTLTVGQEENSGSKRRDLNSLLVLRQPGSDEVEGLG